MPSIGLNYAEGNRTWSPCWTGKPQPRGNWRFNGQPSAPPGAYTKASRGQRRVGNLLALTIGLLQLGQVHGKAFLVHGKTGAWHNADRVRSRVLANPRTQQCTTA